MRIISLITSILMLSCALGQVPITTARETDGDVDGFKYSLLVKTSKGGIDVGRDVVFIETTTYERIAVKTNNAGRVELVFDHGDNWLGSVGEMRNCIEFRAGRGSAKRTITYNPVAYERGNRTLPDRRSVNFKRISQKRLSPTAKTTPTESIVNIVLVDNKRKVYPGINVNVCCFATETIYEGVTNGNGAVTFLLPNSNDYEVDVDGVKSLRWIDLDQRSINTTMQLMFQPREFTEQSQAQFIVQNVKPDVSPSSSHARIKLKVIGGSKDGIQEDVYVRMLKSNSVYKAKTNDQGEVTFMLPIRNQYFIDFDYQKGAKEIDLSKAKGIVQQNMTVQYVPDPRLENIEDFIPSVKELIDYDIHNFVNKQYPEPVMGDVDFYMCWGNKFNKHSKEALLEIGLKVRTNVPRKSEDPLNVCFVVDKSGSMMGEDRIEQLKRSLIQFVSQLGPKDIISIVVFDNEAKLAVPAEAIGDKKKIIDIIHAIQAGGGTLIYDGMVMGFDEVKKNKSKTSINRVILLTDGYGSTPPEEIIAKAKGFIAQGIELSAVGVGVDYNQALLSQLASAGGGLLHLAGNSANIQDAFQHELETVLYPMAKNATLTVTYHDQIVYRQLYGYSNEQVSKGKMEVGIPHLFPGLDQLALIKFDLINPTKDIEREAVHVTLTYDDATTGAKVKREQKIHPEWTTATGELDMTIDKEHKKVLAVAIANQSLKVMANSFESGDRVAAAKSVQSAMDQIQALFPDATPAEILPIVDRLTQYVDAFRTLAAMKQH
ncbi:MAG: Mg-chelatase subunit ChlD [Crocinitomicaceae bacterium]|jgi:Mg-chelatase subunit ChlD